LVFEQINDDDDDDDDKYAFMTNKKRSFSADCVLANSGRLNMPFSQ